MTTDFRALCAELVQAWDDTNGLEYEDFGRAAFYLVDRARAALAQEQQGPTVMQIIALADEIEAAGLGQVDLVRAALARWGGAAPRLEDEQSNRLSSIAHDVLQCAHAWEPEARLIGNVRAEDIADLCNAVLARWGGAAPQPEVEHG